MENIKLDTMELKPAFIENNVALLLCAGNLYVPYLSVVLQSILENSSAVYNYDIIIFTSDISIENQIILQEQLQAYTNFSIRFYNVVSVMESYMNLYLSKYYTIEIYFRLLAPNILKSYDKILYLDSDIIVQEDVAKLYTIELSKEYLLAACRDIEWIATYNANQIEKEYVNDILKLKNPQNYFQSGIILLNLETFRNNFTNDLILQFATTQNWTFPDQDILNSVAQERVLFLDPVWNIITGWSEKKRIKNIHKNLDKVLFKEYMAVRSHPNIIHYAGAEKPWLFDDVAFADKWWQYLSRIPILYKKNIEDNLLQAKQERKKLKYKLKRFIKKIAMPFVNLFFPKGSERRKKFKEKLGVK